MSESHCVLDATGLAYSVMGMKLFIGASIEKAQTSCVVTEHLGGSLDISAFIDNWI
jgi:hypothetical protein